MSFADLWSRLCSPAAVDAPVEWDGGPHSGHDRISQSSQHRSDTSVSSGDDGDGSSDHDSSSNDSDESMSDDSSHDSDPQPVLSPFERRQAQTKAARDASLKSRMMKKVAKQLAVRPIPDARDKYIPHLQPNNELSRPGGNAIQKRKDRSKLIWSWLTAACKFLNGLIKPDGNEDARVPCHIIGIAVLDDTNVRLGKVVDGRWKSHRVVTAMNMWQSCVVSYQGASDEPAGPCDQFLGDRSFHLHTPPSILPRANASSIWMDLRGWLFGFAGMTGVRWQKFGLKPDLLADVPLVTQFLCYDSLKTNVKVVKMLRENIFDERARHPQPSQARLMHGCTPK